MNQERTVVLIFFGCLIVSDQTLALQEQLELQKLRDVDPSKTVSNTETLTRFYSRDSVPHEVQREIEGLKSLSKLSDVDQTRDGLRIPQTFDARKKWKSCAKLIETVWDQGNCRSSSVVAAASMAADRLCIQSKGNFSLPLSAQHLMGCSSSCAKNELLSNSLNYITKEGIPTGGPYSKKSDAQSGCIPFEVEPCDHTKRYNAVSLKSQKICNYSGPYEDTQCPDDCTNEAYSKPIEEDVHKFKVAFEIDDYDERRMRREIFEYGPITVSFVLFDDFLTYKQGVYRHYGYGPYIRIQSVKLIGWGVEKKVPYWLGVNSFGPLWGENGLFKFFRGRNHLFIETMVATGRF